MKRRHAVSSLLLLLGLAFATGMTPACGSAATPAPSGGAAARCAAESCDGGAPATDPSADAGGSDAAAKANDGGASPTAINVVESNDPKADWACADRASCIADYETFIQKAGPAYGHPISQATLDAQVKALDDKMVPLESKKLSQPDLASRIVAGANIGFLMNGIDARKLEAKTTEITTANGVVERDLLFVDPWVGTFKGILLTPAGPGPFPTVIAIHGHPDDAEIYRDSYHGKDFPGRGYAILMLTMRAMAIDAAEHQISIDLLRGGFTLVGLRVYETLLGLKYLRFLSSKDGSIDAARVGLIGHSGGSSASDLTVRIEPRVMAYVSDNSVDWHRSDTPWDTLLGNIEPTHCETVPALYPVNEQIRDFATSQTPIDKVAYATAQSQSGNDGLIAFFDQHLK